jgi:CheY-like chemotaxis protein
LKKEQIAFFHDLTNELAKVDGYLEMLKSSLGREHDLVLKIEKANREAFEILKIFKKNIEADSFSEIDSNPSQVQPVQKTMESSRCRVLIVDDEEDLRDLLEHILKSFGFDVKTASNGKMALDLFQEFQFDLVVSDIKMPHMDGLTFLEKLRKLEGIIQPKFFFITGGMDVDSATKRFMEENTNGFLAKPFRPVHIYEKISQIFPQIKTKKS